MKTITETDSYIEAIQQGPTSKRTAPERDALRAKHDRLSPKLCLELLAMTGTLEQERNAMLAWITQAAPMLSTACGIVIEDSLERLDEISGCRGLLELCPVDYLHNDQGHSAGRE